MTRTYVETFGYVAACEALGHTPHTIAKHLGVGLRTSYRYASGDTPVPKVVSLLLDAWLLHGDGPPRRRRSKTITECEYPRVAG